MARREPGESTVTFLADDAGDQRFSPRVWDLRSGQAARLSPRTTDSIGLRRNPRTGGTTFLDGMTLLNLSEHAGETTLVTDCDPDAGFAWARSRPILAYGAKHGGIKLWKAGVVSRLTPASRNVRKVMFSPADDAIWFTARGRADEWWGLYKTDVNSGRTETIATPPGDITEVALRPRDQRIAISVIHNAQSSVYVGDGNGWKQLATANASLLDWREECLFFVDSSTRAPPALRKDCEHKGIETVFAAKTDYATVEPTYVPLSGIAHAFLSRPDHPSRAVIFVHGGPQLHLTDSWHESVQALVRRDAAVIRLNYRGSSGYGHRFERAAETEQVDDIAAAIVYARDVLAIPARNIVLLAHSYGAHVVIQGLRRDAFDVGRVVLQSTPPETVRSPLADPPPVVVFHGERDRTQGASAAKALFAAILENSHEFITVPDEGHNFKSALVRAHVLATALE
jgi:alpha/beta superfamily hydrolase